MTYILLNILYAVIVLGLSAAFLSMEFYARKARVAPAPSTPWMRAAVIRILGDVPCVGAQGESRGERGDSHQNDSPLIYELGSGWGALAIAAAKEYPQAQIIAVELSPLPLWISKMRARIGGHKNIRFICGNFYDLDLGDADVVLTYLTINLLKELRPKLEAELKPGACVICNTFPVEGWVPAKTHHITKMIYDFNIYTYVAPIAAE